MPNEGARQKSSAPKVLDRRWIAVLLLAVTIGAYWPSTSNAFINYDDPEYVTANAQVQQGLTWEGLAWALKTDCASNWHPITWVSHMLDVTLFGRGPAGPHAINLLLHILNSLLLFLLLERMTDARWRSALAAGFFALHPLHVESVAWVAERKDLLSAFFGMLTLLAYRKYAEVRNDGRGRARIWYLSAMVAFVLGLMSKPMLVTLPLLMLLLDYWPLERLAPDSVAGRKASWQLLMLEKVPFGLISAVSCGVTLWAQQAAMLSLDRLGFGDRVANALVAYIRYLGKILWPDDLALPYLHRGSWPAAVVLAAAALVIGISAGSIWLGRKHRYVVTGWFWYMGTLVPVIGLVQVGAQAMADRYTYVPAIGIFIIVAWGLGEVVGRWSQMKAVTVASSVLILAACGVVTHRQVQYWHDSETLFKHSADATADNFIALGNVGSALFDKKQLDEALEYYREAVRINPNYAEGLNSIGAILSAKGDDTAIEWFERALAVQPALGDALFNMGNYLARKGTALVGKGEREAAVGYFEAALRSNPDNYEARNNLGNVLMELGRMDEAVVQYRQALETRPDVAMLHKNLGEALAAKGKLDDAVLQYRKAIGLSNEPGTHYSLGMTLAVQGKWDAAVIEYEQTVQGWHSNAEAYYNLGYALKMQGRLDLATSNFLEAVRLKPDFPLAHFNLGCVLADQKEPTGAVMHLRQALRLKPDYDEARRRLEGLEAHGEPH